MQPEFSLFQDMRPELTAQITGIRFDFLAKKYLYQLFIFNEQRIKMCRPKTLYEYEEDYASLPWFDTAQIQKLKEIHAI